MAVLRRRLRVFATTWLVFQAVWIAALVPLDCCAAHRPVEKSGGACHESVSAAGELQTMAATGHEHHARASEFSRPSPAQASDCRVSGLCDGPMAGLFALLSQHGILPAPPAALLALAGRDATAAIDESVAFRFVPPDSPPPRS